MRGVWILAVLILGCDGREERPSGNNNNNNNNGTNFGATDPRCDALCAYTPEVEGAGDVCGASSIALCKASCTARIKGLSSLCQTCVLDEANGFGRGGGDVLTQCISDGVCPEGRCERQNQQRTCSFCQGDETASLECYRQVYPLREVLCSLDPGTVLTCADTCSADKAVVKPSGNDPRCEDLCRISEPAISGSGDVCSAASQATCLTECNQRVAGLGSLCASCLLEDASRLGISSNAPGKVCQSGSGCTTLVCEESGPGGSCTFCQGDQAGYENCMRQAHPRREVSCTAEFRPVTECASVCGS